MINTKQNNEKINKSNNNKALFLIKNDEREF